MGVIYLLFLSGGIPDGILDKTWHAPGEGEGERFVIYKEETGAIKAIWQLEGERVYVEQSIIYEVDFAAATLYFSNGVRVLGNDTIPVEEMSLSYSMDDNAFISLQDSDAYKIIAERPIIYSKYGWLIDLDDLKSNSLEVTDFE